MEPACAQAITGFSPSMIKYCSFLAAHSIRVTYIWKIDGRFDWYPNIQPSPLSPGMHTVHLGLLQFANASTIHLLNDYGVFRVLLATMLCVCAELVGSCCSIELNQNCWCMLRWCKSIWKAGAYDPWLQQMVPIQQNQARYILKGTYLALFVSMLWYCCMVYYCSTYIQKKTCCGYLMLLDMAPWWGITNTPYALHS